MENIRIIAIDFDGCLCKNKWPEIGTENKETIRRAQEERMAGSKLILWTCRRGVQLEEAVTWCKERGLVFDAVNEPVPEMIEQYGKEFSRKVYATEYWDDRAVVMPLTDIQGLNRFAEEVHNNAALHGWWNEPRSFGDIIALCHSELSEALEEFRNGKPAVYYMKKDRMSASFGEADHNQVDSLCGIETEKPEGIAVEMADCIIRILDWCGHEGVDIEAILQCKHQYNKTRPYKHGGKAM